MTAWRLGSPRMARPRICRRALLFAAVSLALSACSASIAAAEYVGLRGVPIQLTPLNSDGPARFVGGLHLSSSHPEFGGFSGLLLDGSRADVVTDRGQTLRFSLERSEDGRIMSVRFAVIAPLVGPDGAALEGEAIDAEALARQADGSVWIAFERNHRITLHEALGEPAIDRVAAIETAEFQYNGGVEALAVAPDGALVAIAEDPVRGPLGADSEIAAWRYHDGALEPFRIARLGAFAPTGAALGPDGALYLLERAFSRATGVRMRIRRFPSVSKEAVDAAGGALGTGETLITLGPLSGVDNMEGLAVEATANGGVLLTVISDDNFNPPRQRTLLLQFVVDP